MMPMAILAFIWQACFHKQEIRNKADEVKLSARRITVDEKTNSRYTDAELTFTGERFIPDLIEKS